MKRTSSWYRPVLRSITVMALSVAFVMATSGCAQKSCGVGCDKQSAAKCKGKCKGKCTTPCKNADGSKKCAADCKKPCCAKDAKTSAAVNTKCPISGRPVNPNATLVSGGKTIAFCCNGCTGKWNKLSADEQAEKLAAAK